MTNSTLTLAAFGAAPPAAVPGPLHLLQWRSPAAPRWGRLPQAGGAGGTCAGTQGWKHVSETQPAFFCSPLVKSPEELGFEGKKYSCSINGFPFVCACVCLSLPRETGG